MGSNFQYASNDTRRFGIPDDTQLWIDDSNPVSTGYEAFTDLAVGATATDSNAIDSVVKPPWKTATNQQTLHHMNPNDLVQIVNSR